LFEPDYARLSICGVRRRQLLRLTLTLSPCARIALGGEGNHAGPIVTGFSVWTFVPAISVR